MLIEDYAISYPTMLSLLIKYAYVTIPPRLSLAVSSKAANLLFARGEELRKLHYPYNSFSFKWGTIVPLKSLSYSLLCKHICSFIPKYPDMC
jgi:hypothetical protein